MTRRRTLDTHTRTLTRLQAIDLAAAWTRAEQFAPGPRSATLDPTTAGGDGTETGSTTERAALSHDHDPRDDLTRAVSAVWDAVRHLERLTDSLAPLTASESRRQLAKDNQRSLVGDPGWCQLFAGIGHAEPAKHRTTAGGLFDEPLPVSEAVYSLMRSRASRKDGPHPVPTGAELRHYAAHGVWPKERVRRRNGPKVAM